MLRFLRPKRFFSSDTEQAIVQELRAVNRRLATIEGALTGHNSFIKNFSTGIEREVTQAVAQHYDNAPYYISVKKEAKGYVLFELDGLIEIDHKTVVIVEAKHKVREDVFRSLDKRIRNFEKHDGRNVAKVYVGGVVFEPRVQNLVAESGIGVVITNGTRFDVIDDAPGRRFVQ